MLGEGSYVIHPDGTSIYSYGSKYLCRMAMRKSLVFKDDLDWGVLKQEPPNFSLSIRALLTVYL